MADLTLALAAQRPPPRVAIICDIAHFVGTLTYLGDPVRCPRSRGRFSSRHRDQPA